MTRSTKELQTEIAVLKEKQRQLEQRLEFPHQFIQDHLLEGVVYLDLTGQITWINRAALLFFAGRREKIINKHFSEINILSADDLPQIEQVFERVLKKKRVHFNLPITNFRGKKFFLECTAIQSTQAAKAQGILLVMRDITDRIKTEKRLRQQRNLGNACNKSTTLESILNLSLACAINITEMDSGGIYLVDEKTGALTLACHHGLSEAFVQAVSYYPADAPSTKLMQKNKPIFKNYDTVGIPLNTVRHAEKLKAVALVPVFFQKKLIAVINVASHTRTSISKFNKMALESTANQIGSLIARAYSDQALRKSESLLDMFFKQSMDGFFFMMLDDPIHWDGTSDKEKMLDYIFTHQRITRANQAMLDQYRATADEFIGQTPVFFWGHNIESSRQNWKKFLDKGQLKIETEQRRFDGTKMWIEGDYICLYDAENRITGHFGVQRDITERKKTELALRESQRTIETLFANLPGMAYRCKNDADWTMNFISDGCSDLTGYEKGDLLNNNHISYNEIIHPDDRDYVAQFVKNGIFSQKQFFIEYRIVTKAGMVKTVWEGGCGIFDKNQNLMALEGFIMDITRRVAAEKQMRESEEKHRLLFETMAQGVIYYNSDGTIISVNPAAERILGVSAADLFNYGFFDFFTTVVTENGQPFEIANYPARISMKTGMPQRNVIMGIHHPIEKKQKWIEINSVPQCRKNEIKPYQVYMTFTDITERQEQEQERKRLITALEQSKDMIIITDARSQVVYVNPAFEKTTGFSQAEVMQKPLKNLRIEDDQRAFIEDIWPRIRDGKTWQGHFLKERRDGTPLHEQTIICPVFSESGQIINYVAVMRDMSREIALEEQLRQSQKMEAVGRLAGGVAHDFNNLLTIITGYCDLLLSEPDFPTQFSDEITQIHRAGEQAAALTRQLLAFSRKQLLQPQVLDLNTIITQSMKMYQRLLSANIEIVSHLQPGIPAIFADPHQIEQILINLIVNARDAILDKKAAPLTKQITIGTASVYLDQAYTATHLDSTEGLKTMISIKDTGTGMTPDVVKNIFEPFYTTKKMGKGTGLGLSTVYGIVRQNHASISVHSTPGAGTEFRIFWPVKEDVLTDAATTDSTLEKGREKILLVEDENRVRTFTQKVLVNLGYSVIPAENAEKALELFKTVGKHVDLVLTDLVMPGLNGRELADQLLAERPNLPIIYFSGYTDDHIARDTILNKNICFIQKPFTIATLSKTIREQLAAVK